MRSLRILTANIAMGNPRADNPLIDLYGLTRFHNWRVIPFVLFGNRLRFLFDYSAKPNKKRVPYFKRVSDLHNTLELVRRERPDLLVLNELFVQLHGDAILLALQELGFKHFSKGIGSHHSDTTLFTLVASRLPILEGGTAFVMPQRNEAGGGGGATSIRLKDHPITLIGCHFGTGNKELFAEQVRSLVDFARAEQSQGRQVIAAGDFNAPADLVQSTEGFSDLHLKSTTDRKTCPVGVPKIFQIACDHIFIPASWQVRGNKFPAFGSDHLAVSIETELA